MLEKIVEDELGADEPVGSVDVPVDGIELAEEYLPSLRDETMFWPTLVELVRPEPVTSFFVFEGDPAKRSLVDFWQRVPIST